MDFDTSPVVQDLGTWTYGRQEVAVIQEPPSLAQIKQLQTALAELPQVDCPVRHFFAPGMYTRECTIPAGSVVVGKMHRHVHPVFLLSGTVRINTDRGMETITGPRIWISQENAKRALYTLTDCVFATCHLNPYDTTDLEAIEADVIVPDGLISYDAQPTEQAVLTDALQGVYA